MPIYNYNRDQIYSERGSNMAGQYNEAVELLYSMTREELRRLSWEALLISDGPDKLKSEEDVEPFENADSNFIVEIDPNSDYSGFVINAKKGWTT
jgi:hypothetical protein